MRTTRRTWGRLAAVVAALLVVDVVATGAVFLDRRDAPALPDFVRVPVSVSGAAATAYAVPAAALGFSTTPEPPAQAGADGSISFAKGEVDPEVNASYAIAALQRYRMTGDEQWVRRAERAVEQALAGADSGLLPHRGEARDVFGVDLPSPGYSARAQGLMLSALAGLREVTGDPRWSGEADPVFAALTRVRGFLVGSAPAPEPWLALVDPSGYLWFEQFTFGAAPAAILENQLATTLGILDYRRTLADTAAERRLSQELLAGALATVIEYTPKARVEGQLSLYSLAADAPDRRPTDGRVWLRALDPRHHLTVQAQLRILADLVGDPVVADYARLLDRDDDPPAFRTDGITVAADDVAVYADLQSGFGLSLKPFSLDVDDSGRVVLARRANAEVNATYALAALATYRSTGDDVWVQRAGRAVQQVLDTGTDGLLPYGLVDYDAFGNPLNPPWHSAAGQGLMLSALAALHDATGQRQWLEQAAPVFTALQRSSGATADGGPPPDPWLNTVDRDGYLWFEQFPQRNAASLVVSGHGTAVLGLYDYWRVTGDEQALRMVEGGAATIKHYWPRIRQPGGPPRTSLMARTTDPRKGPLVLSQLQALASITGDGALAQCARQLAEDLPPPAP